jgi:hypothetical protein
MQSMLPNILRTTLPMNNVELLSVTMRSDQDHHPVIGGFGLFFHQHHLIVVVHRLGDPSNTLVGEAGKRC